MSEYLNCRADDIEKIRDALPKTSGDVEVPRLLAIARTHLETAELFVRKAADRLP